MTTPAPDLSKLHIDRDATPPGLRRAVGRNAILALAALGLILAGLLFLRRGGAVPIQVITVLAETGAGSSDAPGATSVTANGYVVARTRASVSAKLPGRLASLAVSEGSFVHQGEIIARLDNADYQAQVTQAQAAIATARAGQIESEADRDQLAREAKRLRDIRTQ